MGNALEGRQLHKFLGWWSLVKKQGLVNLGIDVMTLFGWIFTNHLGVPEVLWSVSGYCEFVGFCEKDNQLYDPQNSGNN